MANNSDDDDCLLTITKEIMWKSPHMPQFAPPLSNVTASDSWKMCMQLRHQCKATSSVAQQHAVGLQMVTNVRDGAGRGCSRILYIPNQKTANLPISTAADVANAE
mmetsp:Transcript_31541/g.84216  ORF Transcript_31541/g.84216 Transcript_31541/m.84216 type:complete len:106 (-) Transcript_31541:896-1213(-)